MTRVASALTAPGLGTVDGIVAEIGQSQLFEQDAHRWHADWRPCGVRPRGRVAASSDLNVPLGVEEFLRLVALHPLFEELDVLGLRHASRPWAPGAQRQEPSVCLPSISFGPVQPLGVRRMIMGQRGRCVKPLLRACGLDALDIRDDCVQRGGHELVHLVRVRALRRSRACSRSR